MWRLLKAELSYYRKYLFWTVVPLFVWICVVFLFLSTAEIERDIPGVLTVAVSITAANALIVYVDRIKSKRDRFFAALPVPIVFVGCARLATLLLFWIITVAAFLLPLVYVMPKVLSAMLFWRFTAFTGLIIYFLATYLMARDMNFIFTRRFRLLGVYNDVLPGAVIPLFNALLLVFVFFFPFVGLAKPLRKGLADIFLSHGGSLGILMLALALACLDIIIFTRRRTLVP